MDRCKFSWQQELFEALQEADPDRQRARIVVAQKLIFKRLGTMPFSSDRDEERYAMLDALESVRKCQKSAQQTQAV